MKKRVQQQGPYTGEEKQAKQKQCEKKRIRKVQKDEKIFCRNFRSV